MISFAAGLTHCGECGTVVHFDVDDALAGWSVETCPRCQAWVLVSGVELAGRRREFSEWAS